MPDRDAALAVLAEPGWKLLVAAGIAHDEAQGDPLRAAGRLRERSSDADPAQRAAALELVSAGRALAAKLDVEDALLAVRGAVEQATSARVASWHASCVPEGAKVLEIGCGCGADTLALAHRAANLIATDTDPIRAACAHSNLMAFELVNARVVPGDGLEVAANEGARADVVFADPDRRATGKRELDPEGWSPPLSALRALAGERRVLVKAAPSLDPDDAEGFDVTYVSHGGECVEAFLSSTADEQRVAAVLLPSDGPSIELSGSRDQAPSGPVGAWLFAPDPAAVRASLLAELCARHGLHLVDPSIAFLTGPALEPTPWLAPYEVIRVLPLRPKDVRAVLRELRASSVRAHCRGVAISAPELESQLTAGCVPGGAQPLDVFATRVDAVPTAIIARRAPPD